MPNWREIPFVRLLVPLLAGILVASSIGTTFPSIIWVVLGGFVLLFLVGRKRFDYPQRWVFGALLNCFFFLVGIGLVDYNNELNLPDHFQNHLGSKLFFKGTIINEPIHKNTTHLHIQVLQIRDTTNQIIPVSGKQLLYLEESPEALNLQYGDVIVWSGYTNPIAPPANPHAFDFRQFMSHQQIHHQSYIKKDQWKPTALNQGHPILKWAYHHRQVLLKRLRKYLKGDQEFAVASALLLGHRAQISDELEDAYSDTGAMHVLAVSGLHVGLVYLLLAFLLGRIKTRHPLWKFFRTLILIVSIWTFALLTGLSPSVTRAATMFTFIIIGITLDRHNNIYNTIACSAFLLLVIDPHMLYKVGFQLSYLALLGIIYFQPKFYKLLVFEQPIIDKIWSLITVSLAAQMLTFPISMYYFHQFPLLFWLSGIIVVPAAMVILPTGILLILLGGLPIVGPLLGKLLGGMLWLMNALIYLLQSIPGSVADDIWLSGPMVVLMYLIVLVFALAFRLQNMRWMLGGLLALLLYSGVLAIDKWQKFNAASMTVYSLSKQSAIDFYDGNTAHFIRPEDLTTANLDFSISGNRLANRIKEEHALSFLEDLETDHFMKKGNYIQFMDTRMVLLNNSYTPPSSKLVVDYLLVKDNPKIKLMDYLDKISCQQVIFDKSNSYYSIKKWKLECQKIGQSYHDVAEEGAFVLTIER